MKKNVLVILMSIVGISSVFSQVDKAAPRTQQPNEQQSSRVELVTYRSGTDTRLSKASTAFRRGDFSAAIEAAKATLEYEPRCMEAQWILALAHNERKELGGLLDALATLAIREANESQYALDTVDQGSKGYVLFADDRTVKIDYGQNDELETGTSFIVYSEGEALQHPVTFQILYVERRPIAEVEVRSVLALHSVAEVVKSYAKIEPGMRVVPKTQYDDVLESTAETQ